MLSRLLWRSARLKFLMPQGKTPALTCRDAEIGEILDFKAQQFVRCLTDESRGQARQVYSGMKRRLRVAMRYHCTNLGYYVWARVIRSK